MLDSCLFRRGQKKQKKNKMKSRLGLLSPTLVKSQTAASCISMLLHALSAIWDKPKGLKYFSIFSGVHWQADTCNWEKTSAKSVWQKMGPVNKTNTHTKKKNGSNQRSIFCDCLFWQTGRKPPPMGKKSFTVAWKQHHGLGQMHVSSLRKPGATWL